MPTLADIEREDKKGLNRALRVATLSRHQLPPQVSAILSSVVACAKRFPFFECSNSTENIRQITSECFVISLFHDIARRLSHLSVIQYESRRSTLTSYRSPGYCVPPALPKAHIAACVRFVKTLQRRRTRVVEARKSRWVGRLLLETRVTNFFISILP